MTILPPPHLGITTRERKLDFIGDKYCLYRAVDTMLMRKGTDWLTDEQLEDLVRMVLADRRSSDRFNRRNRERSRKIMGLPPSPGLAWGKPPTLMDDDDGPRAA